MILQTRFEFLRRVEFIVKQFKVIENTDISEKIVGWATNNTIVINGNIKGADRSFYVSMMAGHLKNKDDEYLFFFDDEGGSVGWVELHPPTKPIISKSIDADYFKKRFNDVIYPKASQDPEYKLRQNEVISRQREIINKHETTDDVAMIDNLSESLDLTSNIESRYSYAQGLTDAFELLKAIFCDDPKYNLLEMLLSSSLAKV